MKTIRRLVSMVVVVLVVTFVCTTFLKEKMSFYFLKATNNQDVLASTRAAFYQNSHVAKHISNQENHKFFQDTTEEFGYFEYLENKKSLTDELPSAKTQGDYLPIHKKNIAESKNVDLTDLDGSEKTIRLKVGKEQIVTTAIASQNSISGSQYIYHSHYELPDAIAGKRYVRKINIAKAPTETILLLPGESLPSGLTLDFLTGIISGTPSIGNSYKFAIQVGGLNYIVHLMVMPASGEILKPNYYDDNGQYPVYQENINIYFAVNELPVNKNTSLNAVLTYPSIANNSTQVANGRFPIISLMHGSGYQGGDYTQVSKILASYGFIVIAPTITTYGSYFTVWNDWQIIQRRGYETILNMDLDSNSKFFGHANREAIGLIGHSWGGATTELNMFQSPARAFVFIDDVSLFDNVKDWNQYFNCFSEPDPYPAKASMILKGGNSNYVSSCIGFEGAFTGPRFLATFNIAEHENFLNVGFNGGPDLQKLYVNPSVSRETNRNFAHHLVAFFKRYLLDDAGAGANLYTPHALIQAGDISKLGGSMAAVRPDWAGQLLINDFSRESIGTNNLGLSSSSTVNATINKPYVSQRLSEVSIFTVQTVTLLSRAEYRHLHIEQTPASLPGLYTETLGTEIFPLDVTYYSHFAFEISQKDIHFANVIPLTVQLMDLFGNKFEMPITSSLPATGFKSRFVHSILLPLNGFSGVNLSKIVSVSLKLGTPSQNLFLEIDNLRFERLPVIQNVPPTIGDQAVTTNMNQVKTITISANDKNGDALSFFVSSQPKNGSVTISGNIATYTPSFNFEGYDQFKIKANDGALDSNAGIFDLTVIGQTPRPIAHNQTINTNDLNDIPITLTGSDINNNPLTFSFLSLPGVVYGELPNLIYSAYPGYHGNTEILTFKVNSGKLDSDVGTITINFDPINHAPQTYNSNITTSKNRPRNFKLNTNDADNNPLIYSFTNPTNGVLSGTPPNMIYTPNSNYSGLDSFTFVVNDGLVESNRSTVSINVKNSNSAPYVSNATISAVSGYPVYLVLNCGDTDTDPVTVTVVSSALNGVTSAIFPVNSSFGIVYTPPENFVGTDTIVFRCNDGLLNSPNGTITFNVTKPQIAPESYNQIKNTIGGVPTSITLSGLDPNNDVIYYELVSQPVNGVISGIPPNLTYTSSISYTGPDGFLFKTSDGKKASIGKISINATAAPDVTAPSVPTNLSAIATTSTSFTLLWSASSDNVAVTGYEIFRNGVSIGTSTTTSFAVTGLTASTTYSMRVRARDAVPNWSVQSTALSVTTSAAPDTVAPSVPAGLASSAITSTGFTLSWTASTDNVAVTGYEIFRNGVSIGTSATTSFAVTGLSASTTYSMRVRARDAVPNWSVQSTALSVTTSAAPDTVAPSVPAGLASSAITSTGFTLSWTASTDNVAVTGYEIFRNGVSIGTSATTSFAVTGLTASTTYSMRVRARDAVPNWSAQSTALSVTTSAAPDTVAPSVPAGLASSAITSTGFTLSWTASTDNVAVTGYEIFRNGVSIGTSATTSFAVTGLSASTTYIMRVNARDAVPNWSAQSSAFNVTTLSTPDTIPPSAPNIGSASGISATSITISWSASTDNVGVIGYKIFRNGVQIGTSVLRSFTTTGLTSNTVYVFTVSAFDAAGNNSSLSNAFSVKTSIAPDTTTPTAPTNLSATSITQTSLKLGWTASTDNIAVIGYNVFRNGVHLGWTLNLNYDVTGLMPNTSYFFTVTAYDNASNHSVASAALVVKTLANIDLIPPTQPLITSAYGISQTFLTLKWNPSTDNVGVAGYTVFKNGVSVGTTITNTFQAVGLTSNTQYSFTVSAFDAAGNNSLISNALNVKTIPNQFTLNVAAGANGSVSPVGYMTVYEGTSKTILVTPNIGYQVDTVFLNNVDIGPKLSFTISNISSNNTVNANFKPITNRISTTSSISSSITPYGSVDVNYGGSQSILLTPNQYFVVEKTLVDGVDLHDFNQASFSEIEIVLSKNAALKSSRSNDNNFEILDVYRLEGPSNLKISYEIAAFDSSINQSYTICLGEIQWSENDFEKKAIALPEFIDDDPSFDSISIKILSVESNNMSVSDEEANGVADTNQTGMDSNTSSGGSGGCNYSANMSKQNQLNNLFSYVLLFIAMFLIRKIRRKVEF